MSTPGVGPVISSSPSARYLWHRHPGVRSGEQLTLGERAADKMRNSMGSWAFVFAFLAGMGAWAALNSLLLQRGFDPYPFVFLNLMLSCLAGLQGAILLIAAKRSDQVSAELATHDYQVNQQALAKIDTLHGRVEDLIAANAALTEQNRTLIALMQGTPVPPASPPIAMNGNGDGDGNVSRVTAADR